jgi:hypothetical protein
MQLSFGSGALWGERTDIQIGTTGGNGARQFGVLQDIKIDFDWTEKPLYGQYQFPVAIGRGMAKIGGTCKFAQIYGNLYSDIFFGQTPATGQFIIAQNEAQAVPASSPYTVTVTNASAYNDDLGVTYAATGKRFTRVATPSAAGQYSVSYTTGVYTFSSADASAAVLISYAYNSTASGTKLTISNELMGVLPTFKATFYDVYQANQIGLRLNACAASKLSLPTVLDNWTINELTFSAFADASGTIGYLSTVE